MIFSFFKKPLKNTLHTIAFYNLENLFDVKDDKNTLDIAFTPLGEKRWTPEKFDKKCKQLAKTLSQIGTDADYNIHPAIIGIAEVENKRVLQALIATSPLKEFKYQFVHYESPDERGIDTALLYDPQRFEVHTSEPLLLQVHNPNGDRDTTRDILYIIGTLNKEMVHLFINHWPSRRTGREDTAYKRIIAAQTIKGKVAEISNEKNTPKCIIMGDFNDDPSSDSMQELVNNSSLYNPMKKLHIPKRHGSTNYKGAWNLFDQILVSNTFLQHTKQTHSFQKAAIYDHPTLMEKQGKYKGHPFRTFVGNRYLGGSSDHFPVYIRIKLN